MTTQELHIGVNLELQKVASNIRDDFLPEEIDYFLNDAVNQYIKQQYSQIKLREENIQSQFVHENLYTLIKQASLTNPQVGNFTNSVSFDLPNDYLFYLHSQTAVDTKTFNNKDLEPASVAQHLSTDSNSPIFREFPVLILQDTLTVIGDARTSMTTGNTSVVLTYIKKPAKISLADSPTAELELPVHSHKEVIEQTVAYMLEVIQPQGDSQ